MKKSALLGVMVTLIVVAAAFLLIRHRVASSTMRQIARRAKQSSQVAEILEADRKDDEAWSSTPEYKTVMNELKGIAQAAEARGGPTADQAEVLINYMNSPHSFARETALIAAGTATSDPARSVLIPHVLSLLSDPVPSVRLWAAGSLGRMGDKSVIPDLQLLLKDRPPVAETAQRAISKLRGDGRSGEVDGTGKQSRPGPRA